MRKMEVFARTVMKEPSSIRVRKGRSQKPPGQPGEAGMASGSEGTGWLENVYHTQERESKQEVRLDYQATRPAPSDSLPPLLKSPQCHQPVTKCYLICLLGTFCISINHENMQPNF